MEIAKIKLKIVNIGMLLAALLVAVNVYKGQVRSLELLKSQRETEAKKNEALENLKKMEKKISSYKELLNKKDESLIINDISSLARESDLKIVSVRPEQRKDYPVYSEYSFYLDIRAKDYHQLGRFVSQLEASPNIYSITSLEIRPSVEKGEAGKITGVSAVMRFSTVLYNG
jgi:Tfp pilus assembly protein PilO